MADVQQRFPAAVTVDCLGRTADEVATAALDGLGLDATAARSRDPLIDALARHRGESIVLLANAQWAGPLFSSDEPFRVGVVLAGKLGVQSGSCVRVVVEADADHERVAVTRGNDVLLESDATPGEPVDRLLAAHPALWALAAAETRHVPLQVWALLAQALGISATVRELSALADALPGELLERHITDDESQETVVGFRSDGIKHLIRAAHPLTADRQRALTEELVGHLTDRASPDPVHSYATQTAALHAALSGTELPGLLANAPALAHSTRYALLQALARQWKHGVPQGGVASDIHYLEAEGIAPSAQGEWVSWLHWAALNRGDTAAAERLATAGIALPWRTAWSRRRPYAAFGPLPGEAGNVDYLESGTLGSTTAVAGQRVLPAFHDGEYAIPDGDERVLERVWSVTDGTELGTPAVIDLFFDDEGEVESAEGRGAFRVRAEDPADAADRAPLRLPRSVLCHRRVDAGRWALGGRGGLFAIDDLRPASTPDEDTGPARWRPPLVAPHTTSALWNIPAELASPHGPSPAALAAAFGPNACRTLTADALPAGLDDTARRYLTDIGLPALYGRLYFATLAAIDETGLSPADWPAGAAIVPNGDGPFFPIGTWLGSDAYLDGATGQVIQDGLSGGSTEPVIAGSLRQYVSLLWLCRAARLSAFPTADEERDAQSSARKWAAHVDPIVEDSATWKAILSGSLESDLIAGGWELPGLKPA
ncbi:hypothetical protein [Streptomyces sp. bgisy084]|uniref:hypothetical protein n=1 Tax=unclassified Streptomyces TaxID=2593676 RepID=UPI003D71F819